MKMTHARFRKTEPFVLSTILIIISCLWGFVHIADSVVDDETLSYDQSILLAFRNPADLSDPIGPSFIEHTMMDLSALGSFAVILTVLTSLLGFLILRRQNRLAIFIFISILGGSALSTLLKSCFLRARPDLVTHLTPAQLSSFPSGHTMSATVVYLTLGVLLAESVRREYVKVYILSWSLLLVFLVGISRIYIGVHWPSDVLAGWMGGTAWALMCWLVERSLRPALMQRKVIVRK